MLIAGNEEVEEVDEVAAEVTTALAAGEVEIVLVELFIAGGAGDDRDLVLGIAEVRKVCGFFVDVEVDALNLTVELADPFLVKGKLDRRVVGGVIEDDDFVAGKGGECIVTFSTAINKPDFAGQVKYLLLIFSQKMYEYSDRKYLIKKNYLPLNTAIILSLSFLIKLNTSKYTRFRINLTNISKYASHVI